MRETSWIKNPMRNSPRRRLGSAAGTAVARVADASLFFGRREPVTFLAVGGLGIWKLESRNSLRRKGNAIKFLLFASG
jgi:hypothetical protein